MRTIEKTVYQYEELSDKAKEKARAWYLDGLEFDPDCVIEDAVLVADSLGIQDARILYSGFSSQGDGACFEGFYRYKEGSVGAVKGYCKDPEILRIATELNEIQNRHENALTATIKQRGHYYHSRSMNVDVEDSRTPFGAVDDENNDIDAIIMLMVAFADWIYHQLETEYNYQISDENVADNIIANEYEFTEDGGRYV